MIGRLMNRIGLLLLFSIVSTISFAQSAAQPPAPPQTARQALLEMFTGAKENSFEKHLPEAAVHTLIRKGSNRQTSWVGQLSMFARMAQTPGSHLETFDVGSLLLSFEQNSGREKLELMVEHDDLQGDEDQIELSVRAMRMAICRSCRWCHVSSSPCETRKTFGASPKSPSRASFPSPILTISRDCATGRTNPLNQWPNTVFSAWCRRKTVTLRSIRSMDT